MTHQKCWERVIKDERKMKSKLYSGKDSSDILMQ